jgi:hypothetical protein
LGDGQLSGGQVRRVVRVCGDQIGDVWLSTASEDVVYAAVQVSGDAEPAHLSATSTPLPTFRALAVP